MATSKQHSCGMDDKKDKQIVHGYLRFNCIKKANNDIPTDIANLIFLFYHVISECFKHYHHKSYRLSNEDMTVSKVSCFRSVCYGAAVIAIAS